MLHLRPPVREHGQGETALETFHGQKKKYIYFFDPLVTSAGTLMTRID